MDLSITKDTLATADQSWLASEHGVENCDGVTLDVALFTANTHYPSGFFKSGLPLGKVTSSGKYGPYKGRTNEVQSIAVDATGGTFTVAFDGSPASTAIAFNASAAAVQAALEALSTINPGDVTVTGGPGAAGGATPYVVTFAGRYLGLNVPTLVTAAGSLTGGASTAAVTTGTQGAAGADGTEVFAGFLMDAPRAPASTATPIQGAILRHGKVRSSRLPIAVDSAGQADAAGRIIFLP